MSNQNSEPAPATPTVSRTRSRRVRPTDVGTLVIPNESSRDLLDSGPSKAAIWSNR